MSTVSSPKAEAFYWVTIMVPQTLGTALGDWTAGTPGLRYTGAAQVFGSMLALAYWRTSISRTVVFCAAFVLTRPLGAAVGDFLDKPVAAGGQALSRYSAALARLAFVLGCLLLFPQRASSTAHGAVPRCAGARRTWRLHTNRDMTMQLANCWLLGAALALAGAAPLAQTQAWPTAKPIRLIVGYPPGGGIDFAARTIQAPLQEALGQTIVVDYKPGASGTLAAGELARAAPDGYTVLLANTGPFAIAPYLQAKMPYDPLKQFTYIGQISQGSYIAVTRPDHPAKNLKEWVEWARANAGKVNFASGGIGTSTHLNGELMNQAATLDVIHVPYKGSAPAIHDLIGGQTQLLIDAGSVLMPQIKAGKLKALAVTGPQRDPQLPDVPTVRELGLGAMESVGFQGLVAPAGLPKAITDKLAAALAKVLAQPDIPSKFAAAGAQVHVLGPTEFAAFVKGDNEKWARLIRERKLQLD